MHFSRQSLEETSGEKAGEREGGHGGGKHCAADLNGSAVAAAREDAGLMGQTPSGPCPHQSTFDPSEFGDFLKPDLLLDDEAPAAAASRPAAEAARSGADGRRGPVVEGIPVAAYIPVAVCIRSVAERGGAGNGGAVLLVSGPVSEAVAHQHARHQAIGGLAQVRAWMAATSGQVRWNPQARGGGAGRSEAYVTPGEARTARGGSVGVVDQKIGSVAADDFAWLSRQISPFVRTSADAFKGFCISSLSNQVSCFMVMHHPKPLNPKP